MGDLAKRALTALIAGSVVVTLVIWSGWGLAAFAAIVAILGLYEFYGITGLRRKPAAWASMGLAVLFLIFSLLSKKLPGLSFSNTTLLAPKLQWGMLALAIPVIGIMTLFSKKELDPLGVMSKLLFGLVYTVVPLALFIDFSVPDADALSNALLPEKYIFSVPLAFMFLVWATDTFAYFGGRLMGKHKLFERISPKKTWEGAITGVIGCVAVAVVFTLLEKRVTWEYFIPAAIIISIFGQLGDLVESMFKRSLKIKDSGGILPGHGGILDRFDAFYIALPLVWAYVKLIWPLIN